MPLNQTIVNDRKSTTHLINRFNTTIKFIYENPCDQTDFKNIYKKFFNIATLEIQDPSVKRYMVLISQYLNNQIAVNTLVLNLKPKDVILAKTFASKYDNVCLIDIKKHTPPHTIIMLMAPVIDAITNQPLLLHETLSILDTTNDFSEINEPLLKKAISRMMIHNNTYGPFNFFQCLAVLLNASESEIYM